jgi:phosphohistidine swiveling domain-containing protein
MFQIKFHQLWQSMISFILVIILVFGPSLSYAQSAFVESLPQPGVMVGTSEFFTPILVKGLIVYPDKPLNFDFIVDSGSDLINLAVINEQSQKMAKYFLAAITVSENQLWVNLSPYEKDRVIDSELSQTVLGRDMLAQDYILKQLASSLIYPEKDLGKEFWTRVYAEVQAKFGTDDMAFDTFNKVWIMPEKAEVFEKGNAVYVTNAKLKVMLDSDRKAMLHNSSQAATDEKASLAKIAMREIVVPAIEKEVNEGKNFADIRQIYHAMILAKWYRELIQNTLLADSYVGKNKVAGVTTDEKALKEEIFQRYISSYKKGVFNYIKEESNTVTSEVALRKYFSGGIVDFAIKNVPLTRTTDAAKLESQVGNQYKVLFRMDPQFQSSSTIVDVTNSDTPIHPGVSLAADISLESNEDAKANALHDPRLKEAVDDLKRAREAFAREDFKGSLEDIDGAIKELLLYIAQKGETKDSLALSLYYMAKVMIKAVKASQFLFLNGGERTPTQIVLLDEEGREVLLPRRGPYKRLFAGKLAVSANGKSSDIDSIRQTIKDEFGIVDVDLNRIEVSSKEFKDQLISYDFYAVSDIEEKALMLAVEQMVAMYNNPLNGVAVEYDSVKRSAIVYSLKEGVLQEEVKAVANHLAELSKIPYIYPVYERNRSSLAIYRFNAQEKKALLEKATADRKAREEALSAINKGGYAEAELKKLEDHLATWDSDEIAFTPIDEMLDNFEMSPNMFALDLLLPYLKEEDLWLDRTQNVIPVGSRLLADMNLVGAKAANLKILQLLKRFIEGLNIPRTAAISSVAFERVVLGNSEILEFIKQIDSANDDGERKKIADSVRKKIRAIELPKDMKDKIKAVFEKLGSRIAVRSSANVEDNAGFSGSGLGRSYLNVIDLESVYEHIKDVWASQYDDGFISAMVKRGIKVQEAKMAVVLQQFIDGQAAGVINTYDKHTMRTMYKIVGNWGLGESVVQGEGEGKQDRWIVGLNPRDKNDIMEENIGEKTDFVVADDKQGVRNIHIDGKDHDDNEYMELAKKSALPSLSSDTVLSLAKQIEQIHRFYIDNKWAQQIDAEYVIDRFGKIFIVQARPLNISDEEMVGQEKQEKVVVEIEVVDEEALLENQVSFPLAGATAQPGVVSAQLLVSHKVPSFQESRGKIVIAPNTNNQWNAVFPYFGGVITQQGMEVAHATNNSREGKIPCIVGVDNAIQLLLPYNGQSVTLDAYYQKIYIGKVPTKRIRISNDIWANMEDLSLTRGQQKPHELKRQFSDSMQDWPIVFKRYFDGNLRMRSAAYSTFQIDYYYAAWDRLTKYLNEKYKDRRPFELKTQKRVFRDGRLFNQVVDDDQSTIYYFLAGLKDLTIEDMWELYTDRLQGLEDFEQYFSGLKEINADNIREVMDQLVEGFMWMHIAYWLGAVDHELFITRQAAYVNHLAYPALQTVAVGMLDSKYLLNISRDRDTEVATVLELLRRNPQLKSLQNAENADVFLAHVKRIDPGIHERIVGWSDKYKRDKENIDLIDETNTYYQLLFNMFQHQGATSNQEGERESFLSALRAVFRTKNIALDGDLVTIKNRQIDIYYFISSYVRNMMIEGRMANDEGETGRQTWLINNISGEEIDRKMAEEFPKIIQDIREQEKKEAELLPRMQPYANLMRALQLDKVERTLREDGHHIAIRAQRPLARAMLKAAEKMPFFHHPEDIFQYGIEELVAIFKAGGHEKVSESVQWRREIQDADNYLWRVWSKLSDSFGSSRDTVFLLAAPYHRYLVTVYKAIDTIRKQMRYATTAELRAWYAEEINRLKSRVADTKYIMDKMISFESTSFQENKQRAVALIKTADDKLDDVINDKNGAYFNIFQKAIARNMRMEGKEMVAFFPTKGISGIDDMVDKIANLTREVLSVKEGEVSNSIFTPASEAFIQLAFYERSPGELRLNFNEVAGLVSENAAAMSPFVIKLIGPRLIDDGYIILEYEVMSPEVDALRTLTRNDHELLERHAIEAISGQIASDRIKQSVKQLSDQERKEIEKEAFDEIKSKFKSFNAGIPDIYHSTIGVLKDRSITREDLDRLRHRFQEIRADLAFQQPQFYLIDTLVLGEVDVKSRQLLRSKKMALAISDDVDLASDEATASPDLGGIDFKNIDLISQGKQMAASFDSRANRYLYEMGFDGFTPVLIDLTPIDSVLPILEPNALRSKEDVGYKISILN